MSLMEIEQFQADDRICDFTFLLFNLVRSSQNLVFSPTSIFIALAMAAIGSERESLM